MYSQSAMLRTFERECSWSMQDLTRLLRVSVPLAALSGLISRRMCSTESNSPQQQLSDLQSLSEGGERGSGSTWWRRGTRMWWTG